MTHSPNVPSAFPVVDYVVGRVQRLANRPSLAVPPLRFAVARCDALDQPFEHVRAHDELGRAYEQIDDKANACKAYQVVVDRWGATSSPSITGKHARERLKALKCGS